MAEFSITNSKSMTQCMNFISGLPDTKKWIVKIEEYKPKRSTYQNKLYWLWLGEISEQITTAEGEKLDKDKWHYLCLMKYLGSDIFKINGFYHSRPAKSTTELNTKEFSEYLNKIETEFLKRGVVLTNPNYYGLAMES